MSCQFSALWTGTPVARSHSTVVSRWLVRPSATTSEIRTPAVASASRTTCSTLRQISSGSCSTQPGRGKMWRCSTWLKETIRACRSNTRQREDAVPWSTEKMYRSLTPPFLPLRRRSPRDRPEIARDRPRRLADEGHEVVARRAGLGQALDRARDPDRADGDPTPVLDRGGQRDLPAHELLGLAGPAALEDGVELGL